MKKPIWTKQEGLELLKKYDAEAVVAEHNGEAWVHTTIPSASENGEWWPNTDIPHESIKVGEYDLNGQDYRETIITRKDLEI